MNNQLLDYVSSSQAEIGIDYTNDIVNSNIWKSITIYVMLILVDMSLLMVSITNYDDFNAFVTPVPYIAAASILIFGLQVTYQHRKTIGNFLHSMDTNLYTYPDEHLIQVDYEWYLKNDNIFLFIHFLFYYQIFFFVMISLPAVGELIYYQRIRTFVYPTWTPWKLDSWKMELFTYMIEICQLICAVWFNQIVITFELVSVVELIKQYRRLDVAIRSLEARTLGIISQQKLDKKEYDRVKRQNIEHCIRHHQEIHKSYHLFKIWFETFFSYELAICLAAFAFALYVTMNGTNLPQIWNFFTVLLFIWCGFLIRCLVSEIFVYFNDRLAHAIFSEVDWLRMNKMNKCLILMFHQKISSRFPGLYGLSIFEANRTTLSKIIRSTYSIFNVLKFSKN